VNTKALTTDSVRTGAIFGVVVGAPMGAFVGALTLTMIGVAGGALIGAVCGLIIGPLVGWAAAKYGGVTGGVSIGAYSGMIVGALVGIVIGVAVADVAERVEMIRQTVFLDALSQGYFQSAVLCGFLGSALGMSVGAIVGRRNLRMKAEG